MKKIIEIKNLKKYFKDVKAVDDISFTVYEGELFAFLGLNGAGKSTTINIICHALNKDSGEIYIDGISIDENMQSIYPKLGVVFQSSVLDSKLSVIDNLRSRANLYDLTKSEIEESISFLSEKLAFKDILKRPLNKLSGGQKRRIDIARALIHNPKLLILDEPTTGLDPNTRILVYDLLTYLRKEKHLTILLTTHYMEEATDADNVVILDKGKIVAYDTPNNLKEKYANDFIKVYKYDNKLIELIKKDKLEYKIDKDIVEIVFTNMNEAKEFIAKYKDYIYDFEAIKGKMDNVFLNVTGKKLSE